MLEQMKAKRHSGRQYRYSISKIAGRDGQDRIRVKETKIGEHLKYILTLTHYNVSLQILNKQWQVAAIIFHKKSWDGHLIPF